MRRHFATLLLCSAGGSAAAADGDICSADQHALFSCAIRNSDRIVSVCGSKDLSPERGVLQYRFGSSARLEFSYPSGAVDPRSAFKYFRTDFSKGGTSALSFQVGAWRYSVFSTQTAYGDDYSQAGVIVRNGQDMKKYTCGHITTRTSDFFLNLGLSGARSDVDFVSNEDLMTGQPAAKP